jgi:DNA topoisomerase III
VLLKRGYIVRSGKSLEATDKGIRLIEIVHAEVRSPAMTGQWESYLKRIQRGTASLEPFVKGIEDYVREVVGKVGKTPLAMKAAMAAGAGDPKGLRVRPEPVTTVPERTSESLVGLLHSAFGFSSFRPNQEAVCRAAVEGKDVLLVMPTGSGKSLCYQLPGIARVYKPESRKIPVSFERVQSRRKLAARDAVLEFSVALHSIRP